MGLETEFICPLGCECESIKDDKIIKCSWLVNLKGTDPNTGDEIDDTGCSIAWMPILQIEMSRTNSGQTEAIESFRNETVKGQTEFNELIKNRTQMLGVKNK